MKLPFINKNKENNSTSKDKVYLALDIGTENIKSAIFRMKGKEAEIVGYSNTKQHSNAMKGAMIINMEEVIHSCDIGISEALANADKVIGGTCPVPDQVIMGISGELVKGVSIMAHYEREEPDVPIDDNELEEVVENIKSQAFPDSIEEISEEIGSSPDKIKEINSKINSTYIEGNKVDNPIGFTGSEVIYRVFSTFAPAIHVNSLTEIAKELELEVMTVEVQPYAISQSFRMNSSSEFSGVFIDIGGGTTDIAIIQNGGIIGTKMVGFGGRVFTKRLADKLNLELHDAEKMKLNHSFGKLQEKKEEQVKRILQQDAKLWAEAVEIALTEFDDIEEYPGEFLVSGGGANLPEIKEALISHPWLAALPFTRFPMINFIYPSQLEKVNDLTGLLIHSEDVAPAALVNTGLKYLNGSQT